MIRVLQRAALGGTSVIRSGIVVSMIEDSFSGAFSHLTLSSHQAGDLILTKFIVVFSFLLLMWR